jgi:hypothetical protein
MIIKLFLLNIAHQKPYKDDIRDFPCLHSSVSRLHPYCAAKSHFSEIKVKVLLVVKNVAYHALAVNPQYVLHSRQYSRRSKQRYPRGLFLKCSGASKGFLNSKKCDGSNPIS